MTLAKIHSFPVLPLIQIDWSSLINSECNFNTRSKTFSNFVLDSGEFGLKNRSRVCKIKLKFAGQALCETIDSRQEKIGEEEEEEDRRGRDSRLS